MDREPPCRAPAIERRAICRALAVWKALRQGDALPRLRDLSPPGEDPELAAHLYLLHLARPPAESVFIHCGEALAGLCHDAPAGRRAIEVLPDGLRDAMLGFFASAAQYRKPLADQGSFLTGQGDDVLYRNLLMPLEDETGVVAGMLGAFSWMAWEGGT